METIVDNMLMSEITGIQKGSTMTSVALTANGGQSLSSMITNSSAKRLGLTAGDHVAALFSSFDVVVAEKNIGKVGCNQVAGKVTEIVNGAVNAVVKVASLPGVIRAIIPLQYVFDLGISVGDEVVALINPNKVQITIDID